MRALILSVISIGLSGLITSGSDFASLGTAPTVIVVVGAPGEQEYESEFKMAARRWEDACRIAGTEPLMVGLTGGGTNDLERLKTVLHDQIEAAGPELWLILIGHGTYDGKEAKFNLRGPDLSATDLAAWLEPAKRPLAVINTSSSSAPFLKQLSRPGRVVITATRSGYEHNYARFGQFFSSAIADLAADLDKDGQVSMLEAFLMASREVAEFYKTEGRLATEHALLDDNGDGLGTPPEWFRGIRAVKKAAQGGLLDGLRAHQLHLIRSETERKLSPALRERRNALELQVEEIRAAKEQLSEDEYYSRLEVVLLKLAKVYETSEPEAESSEPKAPVTLESEEVGFE